MIRIYRNNIYKNTTETNLARFLSLGYKIVEKKQVLELEKKQVKKTEKEIYEDMKKSDLYKIAKEKKLKVNYTMNKEKLVEILEGKK